MITSIKISTLSKGIYLNGYEDKDFGANFLITGQVIKAVKSLIMISGGDAFRGHTRSHPEHEG